MNPLLVHYRNEIDRALLLKYAKPSAIILTGHSNRNDPAFQEARAQGAEVCFYRIPLTRTDVKLSSLDDAFYMGDRLSVPLWPYPTNRVIWPNTKLLDMRAGSSWSNFSIESTASIIESKKFDGVFLDAFGPLHAESWPAAEQKAFADGLTDWIRRLDARRKQIDPKFKLICNSFWTMRPDAIQYMDGICIEGHPTAPYALIEARRPYGTLNQRRVLTINGDAEMAKGWSAVSAITHVCCTYGRGYALPQPPIASVGYQDLRKPVEVPPPTDVEALKSQVATLTVENASLLLQLADAKAATVKVALKLSRIDAEVHAP